MDLRVKRPVRNVKALDRVGQRGALELVGREPAVAVPVGGSNRAPGLAAISSAAGFPGRKASLISSYGTSAVEPQKSQRWLDCARIKYRNGLATLAFDRDFVRLPAALVIRDAAQSRHQVVLDNDFVRPWRQFGLAGRHRAAKRANQRLLGRVPLRLAAAGRAGEFLLCCGVGHSSKIVSSMTFRPQNGQVLHRPQQWLWTAPAVTAMRTGHSHLAVYDASQPNDDTRLRITRGTPMRRAIADLRPGQ